MPTIRPLQVQAIKDADERAASKVRAELERREAAEGSGAPACGRLRVLRLRGLPRLSDAAVNALCARFRGRQHLTVAACPARPAASVLC